MPKKLSRARSVADTSTGTIIATVEIASPPERVFKALSSSEVAKWWGQEGLYRTQEWTGDVKVGGRWRATGAGADGEPFSVEGEFVAVDPPHVLAYTWKPDWTDDPTTTVTYRLEAIEGGTRLTLRHDGFTSAASCRSHGDGWSRVLGWLAGFVAPPPGPKPFVIRLLPPRATFPADITEGEQRIMMEHAGYWAKLLADGVAVAFGPVADPKGSWGVAIVELEDASELAAIEEGDPAIRANAGFRYEKLPMMRLVARPA